MTTTLLKSLPLLLLLSIYGSGQDDYWPVELAVPEPEVVTAASDSDSTLLTLESVASWQQAFKTSQKTNIRHIYSGGTVLEQHVGYQFEQLSAQSFIHFMDFSGALQRNNIMIQGLGAGVDWTPVVSYKKFHEDGESIREVQSTIDIGPIVTYTLASVPLKLRGGLCGYAGNDSLMKPLTETGIDDYNKAPGFYSECRIGNWENGIASLPLHVSVNALGKSLEGINLGIMKASALYMQHLGTFGGNDSLFVHIGDSLTNGRELYLGDFGGASVYSKSSWRFKHSFSSIAGVKMDRRLGLRPTTYYRYFINSIEYPASSATLGDLRTTGQAFGATIATDTTGIFRYSGGLELTWEFEDNLFKRKFTSTSATPANRDAYIRNQNDHHSDIARSDHIVTLQLPSSFGTEYTLQAYKNSKRYDPVGFLDTDLTRWVNQYENDRVQIDQKLLLRYRRWKNITLELYGAYNLLYLYYYRAQQSAKSRQTREYRIGVNTGLTIGQFEFMELLYTDAEVTENYFNKIGDKKADPPPYVRDINSAFCTIWKVRDSVFHLQCKWTEKYHDDGYWYGSEYQPDSIMNKEGFYAVVRKRTSYWIDVAGEYFKWGGKVSLGCILQDKFDRSYNWETGRYEVGSLDVGYGFEPYCILEWPVETPLLYLRVKRVFNTQDANRWAHMKNWDISMSFRWMW
jgi:hypothetical protein